MSAVPAIAMLLGLLALMMGAGTLAAQQPSIDATIPRRSTGIAVLQSDSVATSEQPSRRPLAAFNASVTALRDSIVTLARSQIGRRYVYGGESPDRGFDCSGLIRYISSLLEVRLPRTADQQSRTGVRVTRDTSALLPGDLVTFGRGRVSHIGIYVGNNRYIHASPTAGRVIESDLVRPPARRLKPWTGVRRLFVADSTEVSRGG